MPCRRRPMIPLILLCAFAGLPACSGGGGGVVDDDTDTTPPVTITDLVALDVTTTTTRLEWTAPQDRRDDVTDLQPLVDNRGLGAGDVVRVGENPLSATALTVQIPALEARGVTVQH